MKFSAQEEYGLRLLIRIAQQPNGGSVAIPDLARAEQLSEPHVAKLLMILRRSGFITSIRGQLGGYQIGKSPRDIVISDVLGALGGRLFDQGFCERHSGLASRCVHLGDCLVHDLWKDVQNAVDQVLMNRTLQDILDQEACTIRKETLSASTRNTANV